VHSASKALSILPGCQSHFGGNIARHPARRVNPGISSARDRTRSLCGFCPGFCFSLRSGPDASVSVEQFEYKSQPTSAADTGTDWKSDLGIGLATASEVVSSSSSSSEPDWLKQALSAPAPASQDQDQIPDFLRQAGWGQLTGQFQEASSSVADETEAAPAVQADLPDWIKAMAPRPGKFHLRRLRALRLRPLWIFLIGCKVWSRKDLPLPFLNLRLRPPPLRFLQLRLLLPRRPPTTRWVASVRVPRNRMMPWLGSKASPPSMAPKRKNW